MKLLIASDLHGSAFYTKKLLGRFISEKADKLILLGDILYHGPRNDLPKDYAPKEVLEMLNNIKEKIIAVKGNCESEVDQMVLEFPVLAEYAVLLYEGKTLYLTHGHKLENGLTLPINKSDIVMAGHTHIPVFEERENYKYLNPGSVSIPKAGSENSYVVLEDNSIIFKNLEGKIYNEYSF